MNMEQKTDSSNYSELKYYRLIRSNSYLAL